MIKIKHDGNASIAILSLFVIAFLFLWLQFVLFHAVMVNKGEKIQDDVMLSNLAVYKNIDLKALSKDEKNLRINDIHEALETFKQHLKINMKLSDDLKALSGSSVFGEVSIDEFTIYNVKGNYVEILSYNGENNSFNKNEVMDKSISTVRTSDGIVVKNTSIHSTISYDEKLLFGQAKRAETSVDTDIVK